MRFGRSKGRKVGLALACMVLSACGEEPMTEGPENPPAPVVKSHATVFELNEGGVGRNVTAAGFGVGVSLGAKTALVNGTTGGGYKVYFNVQGQNRR